MSAYNHNRAEQSRAEQSSPRAFLKKSRFLRKCVGTLRSLRSKLRYSRLWQKYIYIFTSKHGLEVGGPSEIFSPIYSQCASCDGVNFSANTIWWQKGNTDNYKYHSRILGSMYIADAVNMNCLHDASYDFVMSSNNLEHIANPIKALKEFMRVLKPGGYIVILVPMKDKTFDHNREYTSFEHMLSDYENDIQETDLTHLPEIIQLHDYELDPPAGGPENFKKRSMHNYDNRCLHHHVFCEDSLRKIFDYLGLEVVEFDECEGNYRITGHKN